MGKKSEPLQQPQSGNEVNHESKKVNDRSLERKEEATAEVEIDEKGPAPEINPK